MTAGLSTKTTTRPEAPTHSRSAMSRYLVVTVVATPANLIVLAVLLGVTSWRPVLCNLIAATIVTVPTFWASVAWVWRVDGNISKRAVAFWATSMLNVAASTGAIQLLATRGATTTILTVTPLCVYAILWVARFIVLDRWLFASGHKTNSVRSPTSDRIGSPHRR